MVNIRDANSKVYPKEYAHLNWYKLTESFHRYALNVRNSLSSGFENGFWNVFDYSQKVKKALSKVFLKNVSSEAYSGTPKSGSYGRITRPTALQPFKYRLAMYRLVVVRGQR